MSGFIATLSAQQLRLYTINGELVSYVNLSNPMGVRLNGPETLSPPCVVLAAPSGVWQDGVVLVTGHKDGFLYLWKLSKPVLETTEEGMKKITKPMTPQSLLERKVTPYVTTHNRAKFRELYIATVPVKIHKANITTLKLCSTVSGKGKDTIRGGIAFVRDARWRCRRVCESLGPAQARHPHQLGFNAGFIQCGGGCEKIRYTLYQ